MWTSSVIAFNLLVCAIVAVPTQNDVAQSFQAAVRRQDLQSILLSIEERLRNLDNIYAMHLSPTLEDKLEQYHRKLESLDTKIIMLESLVMLNLDKISENISTKNFKDDVARTSLMKKVDAAYDGLSYKLAYLDRKVDAVTSKMQNKFDTTLIRLEKMDEGLTRRNEDIEIEISDAIAAIDDLKTGYSVMEENIVNNTNDNFEVSFKEHMLLMKNYNEKTTSALEKLFKNTTKDFERINDGIEDWLHAINGTNRFLKGLDTELKRELNDYAVKVADMNSENWKAAKDLKANQDTLETVINSTRNEVQNGIRALMVQVGKLSNKEQLSQADQGQIRKLHEKMDSNFEKIFSAQNLFMDSCYRLQMDESQIESKISDILEKLIATFEQKTSIEVKDIRNLEKSIKKHDNQITHNLRQANANIVTVYDKITKNQKQFQSDIKQVVDHLNALFSLVQDTLVDEQGSAQKAEPLVHALNKMEEKINSINKQSDVLTSLAEEIKEILGTVDYKNSSHAINEFFTNISQIIGRIETKFDRVHHALNENLAETATDESLTGHLEVTTVYSKDTEGQYSTVPAENEDMEKLLKLIFGTNYNPRTDNIIDQSTNMLAVVDLRSNFEAREPEMVTDSAILGS